MKAILVIDIPKDCEHCDCSFDDTDYGLFCSPLKRDVFSRNEKPSWCPLRPMPTPLDLNRYPFNSHSYDIAHGYNICLDEIMGETEWTN